MDLASALLPTITALVGALLGFWAPLALERFRRRSRLKQLLYGLASELRRNRSSVNDIFRDSLPLDSLPEALERDCYSAAVQEGALASLPTEAQRHIDAAYHYVRRMTIVQGLVDKGFAGEQLLRTTTDLLESLDQAVLALERHLS